jgi:hypothetical protein
MKIDLRTAQALYADLPRDLQLATLSPDYVEADASRARDLESVYWCYQEGDSFWYHGFHLSPLPDVDGFDIQSPYGYGGPLANSSDEEFLTRAWAAYASAARAQKVAAEFVRLHPLANNGRFYRGRIADDRDTVWMDLETDAIPSGYQTRVRTAVRKAAGAGLRVSWGRNSEIAGEFARFYREGMSALSASSFYFFDDRYFEELANIGSLRLAICTLDGTWLSAALFLMGAECVEYHLAASSPEGKRLNASNLLLHETAEACKAMGYRKLYLGGGTDSRADNSLLFFKSGFSKKRETFQVGWIIHDATVYSELQTRWRHRLEANPNKVMFYR